jgi:hypothetical protein
MPNGWLFQTARVKLAGWMAPFSAMFTAPTWQRMLVLLIGAVLSPGRSAVATALRVTGLDQDPHFHQLSPPTQPRTLVEPQGESPSQWPGIALSAASAGLSLIM